jgi:putative copper resistance protein D
VYQLTVFIHILAAIVWVGGMLFMALILVPATRKLSAPERRYLFEQIGHRFRAVGWVCVALLIVTGIGNLSFHGIGWATFASGDILTTTFGRLLTAKLLLIALMVIVTAIHDFYLGPASARAAGDIAQTASLRRASGTLARLSAVLALAIVALAVLLVRGLP